MLMRPSLEELVRDPGAIDGLRVMRVNQDSHAERLEFRVGDIITHIDGQAILSHEHWTELRSPDASHRVTLVDFAGRSRDVVVPAAPLIGFESQTIHRNDLRYVRKGARNPTWDEHILAALAGYDTGDFELADEAMRRAVDAGYQPDALLAALRLQLAIARADWDRAAEVLGTLPADERARRWIDLSLPRYSVAMARGDVDAMIADVHDSPGGMMVIGEPAWKRWRDGVDAWQKHAARHATWESWTQGLERIRINDRLRPSKESSFGDEWMSLAEPMMGDQPFHFESAPGHFRQGFMDTDQPVQDFEVVAQFTVRPNGKPHRKWISLLTFTVSDLDRWNFKEYWDGGIVVAGAMLQADVDRPTGWRHILAGSLGDTRYLPDALIQFDGQTTHEVRLRRFGTRVQVLIDDHMLADVPSDPDSSRLAFHIHSVGLTVNMLSFDVYIFVRPDRQLAHVTP